MRAYNYSGRGAEELTGIEFTTVSQILNGGSVASFRKRNFELADITLLNNAWSQWQIKNNAETDILFEGFSPLLPFGYSHVQFDLIDALRVLDEASAKHSSVYAYGQVTSCAGAVLTDSNAAMTVDALIGKWCIVSDGGDQPAVELADPDSATPYTTWDPFDTVAGTVANIVPGQVDAYAVSRTRDTGKELDNENYHGVYLEYDLVENPVSFEVTLKFYVLENKYYESASTARPRIGLYNYDTPGYEVTDGAIVTGLGNVDQWEGYYIEHTIKCADATNYADGDNKIKIDISCGWPCIGSPAPDPHFIYLGIMSARIRAVYETEYDAAGEVYTVDDNNATSLTFTGQTPSDDGVATGDQYRVGEQLHVIMADILAKAEINFVDLNVDSTTLVDAVDHTYSMTGAVFRDYARRMGRKIYHDVQESWTITCKTAVDCGVNLDETDIIPPWRGKVDGTKMVKDIIVSGANNEVRRRALGSTRCPRSPVYNMPQLTTEAAARVFANREVADNYKPVMRYSMDIDADTEDFTAILLGSLIDLDLYTSTLTVSQGLVTEMHFRQANKENLIQTVVIEG